MSKKLIFILSCILIISFLFAYLLIAGITVEQYDEAKIGMTYEQVVNFLGSSGTLTSERGDRGTDNYIVSYRWKVKGGTSANLSFRGEELMLYSKSRS